MEEETVSAGKHNPLEGIEERTQHWLLARSTLIYKKKEVATVQKRHYKLLQNKDWVSFSLTGRMTNLMQLSVTLNTHDTSAVLVLRCLENMVF
jgi:hypothetical protein